jgi:hypothetical protein
MTRPPLPQTRVKRFEGWDPPANCSIYCKLGQAPAVNGKPERLRPSTATFVGMLQFRRKQYGICGSYVISHPQNRHRDF